MITADNLLTDLKNRKFKPLYLLHGEEPFYIDVLSDYIEKNILSDGEKSFNQSILYGKDSDLINIVNASKRYPMMSDYQVILVKEAQELKWGKDTEDKKANDPILAYLENPLPSTILVFCFKYAKFDKRKKTYKAFEKNGVVFESATIRDYQVAAWIETHLKTNGHKINAKAAALMAEYLGTDLSKVANELEKLFLNVPASREITVDDVQNNIGISKDYNVFELQTALSKRDVFKANQIIDYFAANPKSNPIPLIFGALNTYFTKVLRYHYVPDKSPANLARQLGVSTYFLKDYEGAAKNYHFNKVVDVISYLREYDMKTKGVDATGNTDYSSLLTELVFKIIH